MLIDDDFLSLLRRLSIETLRRQSDCMREQRMHLETCPFCQTMQKLRAAGDDAAEAVATYQKKETP
jgi:hypothetical protein